MNRSTARLGEEYQRRLHDPGQETQGADLTTTEAQIRKLRQGIGRLIDSYAEGLIEKGEFEPRVARLKERVTALETEAKDLAAKASSESDLRLIIGHLDDFAATLAANLDHLDWEAQRGIMRTLVKRVEIDQNQVNVVFRIGPGPLISDPDPTVLQHCGRREHSPLWTTTSRAPTPATRADTGARGSTIARPCRVVRPYPRWSAGDGLARGTGCSGAWGCAMGAIAGCHGGSRRRVGPTGPEDRGGAYPPSGLYRWGVLLSTLSRTHDMPGHRWKDSMYLSPDVDGTLLTLVAGGDGAAFDALYGRYAAVAAGVARGLLGEAGLAEDAVQEAFLAVWRQASRYDPARGNVRSWLLTIVRHCAIDAHRRRHADRWVDGAVLAETSDGSDTLELACQHVAAGQVREALGRLPVAQRAALALAYGGGYSQAEIARAQGVALGTVKGRVRLGLRALRTQLAGPEGAARW